MTTLITLIFPVSNVFAADGRTSNTGYAAFWVALAVVYLTRKRKIGGWLFYYYFQTYSYAIAGCSLFRYFATSGLYIKQNMPTSSSLNYTMRYYDTIPVC